MVKYYRHNKRGGVYAITCECTALIDAPLHDMDRAMLCHSTGGTMYVVREIPEDEHPDMVAMQEVVVQCADQIVDGDLLVSYRNVNGGDLYVRKRAEFFDGRFLDITGGGG